MIAERYVYVNKHSLADLKKKKAYKLMNSSYYFHVQGTICMQTQQWILKAEEYQKPSQLLHSILAVTFIVTNIESMLVHMIKKHNS